MNTAIENFLGRIHERGQSDRDQGIEQDLC
jgi:hypothetical protein